MKSEQTQEYDDALVALLELVWGEGYMSPGGPDEIRPRPSAANSGAVTVTAVSLVAPTPFSSIRTTSNGGGATAAARIWTTLRCSASTTTI